MNSLGVSLLLIPENGPPLLWKKFALADLFYKLKIG
jgi:hypothetical protein